MQTKSQRYNARYRGHHVERVMKARQAVLHPFAIPVAVLVLLCVVTAGIAFFYLRADAAASPNVVVISHDREQQVVSSKEPTVGALLAKLDLELHEGDVVEPAPETLIQQDDFRINIYRAVPVEVIDEGASKVFAFSARTTSRSVAQEAGLQLYPEDRLETKPITDFIASGGISEVVTVDRATPVNVNLYGTPVVVRTHATTVKDLLEEKKVTLSPQDTVKPGLDTPLDAAGLVSVVRNGLTTVTLQEDIPVPNQIIPDNTLSYGASAVRQAGAPGKKAVTYEINTQNGVEVGRKVIQTVVIQQPVTQITVQGSNLSGIKGDMAKAGIAPSDYQYADHIISRESGWCPTKWQGQIGFCPPTYQPLHNVNGPDANGMTYGFGLCQSTPAGKMASAGADWATNPVTQIRWCNNYAVSKYGSWSAAYAFWSRNHWW